MPEENTVNPSEATPIHPVSPSPPSQSLPGSSATGATPALGAPVPPATSPPPPDPPSSPAAPPPPPPEPVKDWTPEDTGRDEAKAPILKSDPAYWADPGFFRLVILFAGWVLVLSVGGMLLLAANDKEIPQGIVAAASGLVGLLTGIFAAKSSKT